jgi:hypothetical protein
VEGKKESMTMTKKGRWKRVLAGVITGALAATSLTTLVAPTTASAATAVSKSECQSRDGKPGPGKAGTLDQGVCLKVPTSKGDRYMWLGTILDKDGVSFFCIDYLYDTHLNKWTKKTTSSLKNQHGDEIDDNTAAALAYLIATYAPDGTAGNNLTNAAISAIVRQVMGDGKRADLGLTMNPTVTAKSSFKDMAWGNYPSDIRKKAAALWDEARTRYGPYKVKLTGMPKTVEVGKTVTLTVTVTSAKGEPMSGYKVTPTVKGGTLVSADSKTDSKGKATIKVKPKGQLTVSAKVTGLAGTTANLAVPSGWKTNTGGSEPNDIPQRGLIATSASASAADSAEIFVVGEPKATTVSSASGDKQKVGDKVIDTITITGGKANTTIPVQAVLYGPLPAAPKVSKDAPSGTPKVQTVTVNIKLDANGEGTGKTPAYTAKADGHYAYDTSFAGNKDNKAFNSDYGVKSETGQVKKYPLKMTTTASHTGDKLLVGATLTDKICVTGGQPGATIPVTWALYKPASKPTQAKDAPTGTPKVQSGTLNIKLDSKGAACGTTPGFVTKEYGYYSYDAQFAGNAAMDAYDHGYGVPAESGMVQPYKPAITTASSIEGDETDGYQIGDEIIDTIRVAGAVPNSTVTVVSRLYREASKPAKANNAPSTAELIRTQNVQVKTDSKGAGKANTSPYIPEESGWYSFDADLAATSQALAFDHGYGIDSETGYIDVTKLAITTTSSITNRNSLKVGMTESRIFDTIRIKGGQEGWQVTLESILYGALDAKPVKAKNAPAGTPEIRRQTLTATLNASGQATLTTEGYDPVKDGHYTYDTNLVSVVDADGVAVDEFDLTGDQYGVPSESGFLTLWAPKATTKTSQQLVTGPTDLTDIVTVSGGQPGAPFDGVTTLYGPFTFEPGEDFDLTADGVPVVGTSKFSGTYDETGAAEVESEPQHIEAIGFYVWSEQLTEVPDVTVPTTPAKPKKPETTLSINPEIGTKITNQQVLPGSTFSDTFTASGLVPEVGGRKITYTVTGNLWGPMKAVGGSCEAVDWTDAPVAKEIDAFEIVGDENGAVEVSGIGEFTAPDGPDALDNCWTYGEELTATIEPGNGIDDKPITFRHEKGQESQTTIVKQPSPKAGTQITAQQSLPGHTVSDTLTAEGLIPEIGGKKVTYTVTGALYGPVDAVNGTCEQVDWTSAEVLKEIEAFEIKGDANGNATVSGLGEFTIPDNADWADKCLTYGEQIEAQVDGKTVATFRHEKGQESQTTIVRKPGLSTQVSTAVATPGAAVSDTIKVWDTAGAKATINAVLYGYAQPVDGASCTSITDQEWRNAIEDGDVVELGRQVLTTVGDVEVTTDPVVLGDDADGCATWYEEAIFEGSESSTIRTPYGVETETTLVVAPVLTSEITGFTSGGQVEFGAEVSDSIFLDGLATRWVPASDEPITAVASGELAGPLDRNADGTCEGLDWSKAKVVASYADVAIDDSNRVEGLLKTKLNESGCYSASAEVVIEHAGTVIATADHDFGVASQTVFVKRSGGGKITTGDVPSLLGGALLPSLGLGALGLALVAGAAWIVRRRKA